MIKQLIFILIISSLAIVSCKTAKDTSTQSIMQELKYLEDYTGTDTYEVFQGSKTKKENPDIWIDTIGKHIIIVPYEKCYKFDFEGSPVDYVPFIDYLEIHPNGLMTGFGICTWILDGNKNLIKPTDIQLDKDDPIKHFREYYEKATLFFQTTSGSFRFKIDTTFYDFERDDTYYKMLKPYLLSKQGKIDFPFKVDEPRMVKLSRLNRFTLEENYPLKIKAYEVLNTQRRNHPGVKSTFSDGEMAIELRMKNDTLHFKRGGNDLGAGISLYTVPQEYGGDDDMMILVQKPDLNNQENKNGGFFIIRPRK